MLLEHDRPHLRQHPKRNKHKTLPTTRGGGGVGELINDTSVTNVVVESDVRLRRLRVLMTVVNE